MKKERTFKKKKAKLWLLMSMVLAVCSSCVGAEEKRLLPIYCVDTGGDKQVALTFDAAWGVEDLDQILDILDKYQVRATFFVVGDSARKFPEETKRLADKGHDVANHSDKHPHMNKLSMDAVKADIMAADASIKEIAGKETKLFRPPYGE